MKRVSPTEPSVSTRKPSKAILIFNPEAGRKRRMRPQQIETAIHELERSGISVTTCETTKPGDGSKLAHDAIQSGAELIVVCGGDGTINDVVCGMAHSRVPLAVLPGGTANVLARELGLPLDIVAAARKIPTSTPRRVSLGRAGGRYFLLMAGVGFDARVVHKVGGRWKKRFGMATYVMEALRQLVLEPPCPFLVSSEGQRHRVTFACISNSQHYGPFRMVREADLFSDQFYIYCFHSKNPLRYLLYALAVLAGRTAQLPDVTRFPASKICCEQIASIQEKILFQVDGDVAGELPCTIEVVPDALTLCVPS